MAVTITRQPENVRTYNGGAATFRVEAPGVSSYAWQISADGKSFSSISGYSGVTGAATDTMTIDPAGSYHAGRVYRCLLKDASGNQVTTDVVGITLIAKCVINAQPADVIAYVGDTVAFTVEAELCSYYEWEQSTDGGASWVRIKAEGQGGTNYSPSSTLSVTVTEENKGYQYRCLLRDSSWSTTLYTNVVEVMSEVKRAFAYTGEAVEFTIPVSGIYRLTAVGANGANQPGTQTPATYGGRTIGYKAFKRGDKVYVCCGQAGAFDGRAAYNGGGAGIVPTGGVWNTPSGSGGGATHMATADGTLANLTQAQVLIVAGGSGGSSSGPGGVSGYNVYKNAGGSGGGERGGDGGFHPGLGGSAAQPGTQDGGYGFGRGQSATVYGIYEEDALCAGAGGGGFFGGFAGNSGAGGGAGGSGYIGGVDAQIVYKGVTYTPGTENNYNAEGTDGYAIIELVVKTTLPVTFNGTVLEAITFDGVEITGLIVDGARLFVEQMKRRIAAWCTSMKMARCWTVLT